MGPYWFQMVVGRQLLRAFWRSLGFGFGFRGSFAPPGTQGRPLCYIGSVGQDWAVTGLKNGSRFRPTLVENSMVQNPETALLARQSQGGTSGLRRGTWPDTHGEEGGFLTLKRQTSADGLQGISTHLPRWRLPEDVYVSITLTLDFLRQIAMKKSSDNSKKKNARGTSGGAPVSVVAVLPLI